MNVMFYSASVFNQPLVFDTGSVTSMNVMFHSASVFNQPLAWDISSVENTDDMFDSTTSLSDCNKRAIDDSWNTVSLFVVNYDWSITNGYPICPPSTPPPTVPPPAGPPPPIEPPPMGTPRSTPLSPSGRLKGLKDKLSTSFKKLGKPFSQKELPPPDCCPETGPLPDAPPEHEPSLGDRSHGRQSAGDL